MLKRIFREIVYAIWIVQRTRMRGRKIDRLMCHMAVNKHRIAKLTDANKAIEAEALREYAEIRKAAYTEERTGTPHAASVEKEKE